MTGRLTDRRYIKNFDSKQLNVGIWRYGYDWIHKQRRS